jgi:two-component system, NarL family, nitrate/nitrite response regulator NarL
MSSAPRGARVAVVEDHALFAESLEIALSVRGYDVRRVDLPVSSRKVSTLLPAIVRTRPGIVLLDLDLGEHGRAVQLIEPLSDAGIAVVIVTANQNRVEWAECMRRGARKVLAKNTHLSDILATVRGIDDGSPVVSDEERAELARLWRTQGGPAQELRGRFDLLTHREEAVLGYLLRGHHVEEIATLSIVSAATVRTQVKSILAKLEVSSQLAAVGLAYRVGWRQPQAAPRSR